LKSCNKDQRAAKTFEKQLVIAVDEAFSFLGESVKLAIYFHLQWKFGINREEIPSRLEDFPQAIESIFGIAAGLLEVLIMKNLRKNTKAFCEVVDPNHFTDELTFVNYARRVRSIYENLGGFEESEIVVSSGEDRIQYDR